MSDASSKSAAHYVEEIKNSWRSFRQLVTGKGLQQVETTAVATIEPETATLNSLAKVNEETRERCLNILDRLEDLIVIRQEFVEVVGEVGRVLREAEGTSSTLVERTAMLTREETEHSALKARFRSLHEDSEVRSQQNDLLLSETQRFGDLVSAREARITDLEAELAEALSSFRRPGVVMIDDAELLRDCGAASELSRLVTRGSDAGRALVLGGDAESIGVGEKSC